MMTNEKLSTLLDGKSKDWQEGFWAAVNLNNTTKAAFLVGMKGEWVAVERNSKEKFE